MKIKKSPVALALVFILGGFGVSGAQANGMRATLSAARLKSAPAQLYLRAAQLTSIANGNLTQRGPALWEKGKFENAAWDRVPAIAKEDLQTSFEAAREEKAHTDENARPRRATWLYPDDGCFVRATVAADVIRKKLAVKPAKIFAFDNLTVKTQNSLAGEVSWWYHVAALMKVTEAGVDTFYVYDPAIQSKAPMKVRDWLQAMDSPNAEVAVCSGDAYDPDSDCASGDANSFGRAQSEASWFLPSEWDRLEDLGRDPKRELGDFPPWLGGTAPISVTPVAP